MDSEMAVAATVEQRKIVVAVDESQESFYALSWCLQNIVPTNSQNTLLVLLHVRRPILLYPASNDTAYVSHDAVASIETRDREVARIVVERAMNLCSDFHVKVEVRVEDGDPRDVICKMVDALSAYLLVMGSHGYGLLTRTILESVSNHCVQNAKCPVLVVKMPKSSA